MAHLQVKRVYKDPAEGDGVRVLIDRLWPRGLLKEDAQIALWCKDLAPSDALRQRITWLSATKDLEHFDAVGFVFECREPRDHKRRPQAARDRLRPCEANP